MKKTILIISFLFALFSIATAQTVVKVGAFNYYPAIFKDTDGEIKGFYVDALNMLGKKEHIEFIYVFGTWNEGLERIKTGEIDLLTSVALTDERLQFLDYSKTPLLTVWSEIYVKPKSEVNGILDLEGKTLAVMKSDFNALNFKQLAEKLSIKCNFKETNDFEEVFKLVADGDVDAGIVNNIFGAPKSYEYHLTSSGIVFNPFDIFIATKKGSNTKLLELVNSYLHKWKHEEPSLLNLARQKWSHGKLGAVEIIPEWLLKVVYLSLFFVAVLIAFVVLLRYKVMSATKVIRKTEAQTKNILQTAMDGFWMVDLETNIIEANEQACKMLGYTRNEMLKLKITDIESAETWEQTVQHIQYVLKNGEDRFESKHYHKNGNIIDVEVSVKKTTDEKIMVAFIRDITQRKKSELELLNAIEQVKKSEERFILAMNASNDGLFDWNLETNNVYYSPGWKRILGFDDHELQNNFSVWENFTEPEDVKKTMELIEKLISKQIDRFATEFKMKHKNGQWVNVLARAEANFNDQGQAIRIVGTHTDISEQKRAQERLIDAKEKAEQNERLNSTLLNNYNLAQKIAQVGNWEWNMQTNEVAWSDGVYDIFEVEKGKFIPGFDNNSKFVAPEELDAYYELFKNTIENGNLLSHDFRVITDKGKTKYVNTQGKVFYNSDKKPLKFIGTTLDITKRKLMEIELKKAKEKAEESEQHFRLLVENAPEAIFIQTNGNFAYVNKAAIKLYGASTEKQLLGTKITNRIHPDFVEMVAQRIKQLNEHHIEVSTAEYKHLKIDKSVIDVLVSAVPFNFNNNNGALVFVSNITDRKLANERQLETNNLLRMAGDKAKLGGWSMLVEEKLVTWSDQVASIHEMPLGYSPSLEDALHFYAPQWREKITTKFNNCIYKGIPYDEELEIITHNGKQVWVRTIAEAVKDTHGKIIKIQGAFQEISERKHAEEKLKAITNNAQDGIIMIDDKGLISFWNPAAEKILGYPIHEAIGQNLHKLIAPKKYHELHEKRFSHFKNTGHGEAINKTIEFEALTKNKTEIAVELSLSAININNEWHSVGILRDISDRKKIENSLKESEEKLRTLFNTLTEGVALNEIIYDEKGEMVDYKIIEVNHAFYNFGNYTNKQVINNVATNLYGMSTDMIKYFWENHKHKTETAYTEMQSPLEDKYFYVATSPFMNNRFITSFFDITDRKLSEKKLIKAKEQAEINEEKYRLLVTDLNKAQAVTKVGSWKWSFKDNHLEWSDEMYRIFGVEKDKFSGNLTDVIQQRIHPDDRAAVEASNNSAVENMTPIPLEYRIVMPNGTIKTVWAEAGETIFDETATPVALTGIVQDITERKQAEDALLLTRFSIDHASDSMFWMTADAKIIDCNLAACKSLGYTKEELLALTIPDIDDDYQAEKWINHFDELRKHNTLIFETRHRHKDGQYIDVEIVANYLKYGQLELNCAIVRDITERKQAEEALRQSEERLRNLIDSTDGIVWEADAQTFEFNFVSKQAERLLGYPITDWYSDGFWANHLYVDDKETAINFCVACTNKKLDHDFEYRFVAKDGRIIWLRDIVSVVSKNNTPHLLRGIMIDITSSKLAEDALKESEGKLSALFSSMTEMVAMHELVFNNKGDAENYRIIDCNHAYTQITGIKKADAIGKLATEAYGDEKPPYFDEYVKVALTGEPFLFKSYYAPMDKHFSISVVSPKHNQFATITTDITAMVQIQEVISAKNKELENYLYVSSHDLRSPLVNVQGFSQRLQKQMNAINTLIETCNIQPALKTELDTITQKSIPQTLDFIFGSVVKMDTLINSLLQLSRVGRIKMEIHKIDIQQLIKKITDQLNFQLTEISATIDIKQLPYCYGDENSLNQLFSNLFDNAIKYRNPNIPLVCEIEGKVIYNKVIYSVKDNGIGIAPKYLDKIWDVFYRVDPAGTQSGEGIGLNLVKRIVDKHKGKIWVESEEGVGTTFYIELQTIEFKE